jgi:transcriptional regulator with XRE-family HTH domain
VSEFNNSEEFLRKRLRILREKAGLTQSIVAELAGVSYDYYKDIEQGVRPNVSIRIVEKIAAVYGLSIHELFSPQLPTIKLKQKPIPSPHYKKRKGIEAFKKI